VSNYDNCVKQHANKKGTQHDQRDEINQGGAPYDVIAGLIEGD